MDIAEIRAAITACEMRSLTAAAAALGRAPSTISARVAALEHRLGTRLFERTPDGLAPTAAGEWLQRIVPALLDDLAFAVRYLRARPDRAPLTIVVALRSVGEGTPVAAALRAAATAATARWPYLRVRGVAVGVGAPTPEEGLVVEPIVGSSADAVLRDRWALVPRAPAACRPWHGPVVGPPDINSDALRAITVPYGLVLAEDAHRGDPPGRGDAARPAVLLLPALAVPHWAREVKLLPARGLAVHWSVRVGSAADRGIREITQFRDFLVGHLRRTAGGTMQVPEDRPVMGIGLPDLRCAVLAYDNANLSRAARGLGIAQPAATVRLHRLEDRLGLRLFERTTRGLIATAEGHLLHRMIAPLLGDLDQALAEVMALGRPAGPSLRVGLVPALDEGSLLAEALAEAADRWRATHRGHRLHVVEAVNADLRRQVLNRLVDLAVVDDDEPQAGLVVRRLLAEPLAVVRRAQGTASAVAGRIRFAELVRLRLVLPAPRHGLRAILDRAAAASGIALRPEVEIDSMATAVRMARTGEWATVLPVSAVRGAVAAGILRADRIADPQPERRLSLVRRGGEPLDAAALRFVDLFAAYMRAALQAPPTTGSQGGIPTVSQPLRATPSRKLEPRG